MELEMWLTCAICSNELCEPTTLSCGHSFCRLCTLNWCFVYKNYSCPVCRCKLADRTLPNVNFTLKHLIELVNGSSGGQQGKLLTIQQQQHENLMNKISMSLMNTSSTELDVSVDSKVALNCCSPPSTSDSTLSRLNLAYFPVYLTLTIFGGLFLTFLNIVKRFLS